MTIDDAIERVLANEGGYVNDPNDAGGETNWGITEAAARNDGWTGSMRDLPRERAKSIYLKTYVFKPNFDKVAARSGALAAELVDTGANMGPAIAVTFLQRLLNALNRQAKDYPDVRIDAVIGPGTLAALDAYLAKRGADGERRLLAALNCLQGERYVDLAEKRPANEDFLFGWLGRAMT